MQGKLFVSYVVFLAIPFYMICQIFNFAMFLSASVTIVYTFDFSLFFSNFSFSSLNQNLNVCIYSQNRMSIVNLCSYRKDNEYT